MRATVAGMAAWVRGQVGGDPGAIRGHLSGRELRTISLAGLAAGAAMYTAAAAVVAVAGTVFPGPNDLALAAATLAMLGEGQRRLGQGVAPAAAGGGRRGPRRRAD